MLFRSRGLRLEGLEYLILRHPKALEQCQLPSPCGGINGIHRTEAVQETRVPDEHTHRLQFLNDFADAIRRHREHAQLDDEEFRNGRLGQAAAAKGFHGGAHVVVDVHQEGPGGAGKGEAEAIIAADDVADELDGGDEVLVEATREELRRGGEISDRKSVV